MKAIDYYSIIIADRAEDSMEDLTNYRNRMAACYKRFVEQVIPTLDEVRKNELLDWWDFYMPFVGYFKNSDLTESLDRILVRV